jgi:hypothetical protein
MRKTGQCTALLEIFLRHCEGGGEFGGQLLADHASLEFEVSDSPTLRQQSR